jgi:hypothetical protein
MWCEARRRGGSPPKDALSAFFFSFEHPGYTSREPMTITLGSRLE